MTFGNGYNGGRTQMGIEVRINLYDLSPTNDCLYPVGLGFYHSGVELNGVEYTFGSGGSGIFEMVPKEIPSTSTDSSEGGAAVAAGHVVFRESIVMGVYGGGSSGLRVILDDLRSDFGPSDYNLLTKNCNTFSNAFVHSLLGRPIPAYINRLADLGNFISCLLPKQLLEGGGGSNNNVPQSLGAATGSTASGYHVLGGGGRKRVGFGNSTLSSSTSSYSSASYPPTTQTYFSGSGHTLSTNVSSSSTHGAGYGEDLTDRREKARRAALARMEQQQQQ
mmetsp:Transcript_10590/g.14942  ORF Transcript_10590/g.14942 Transcript_10590/m.14942 type:complete len:277 (-) Transcript_10590:42-872(-)